MRKQIDRAAATYQISRALAVKTINRRWTLRPLKSSASSSMRQEWGNLGSVCHQQSLSWLRLARREEAHRRAFLDAQLKVHLAAAEGFPCPRRVKGDLVRLIAHHADGGTAIAKRGLVDARL